MDIIEPNLVQNWRKECKISYQNQKSAIQKYDTTTLWFVYVICGVDIGLLFLIIFILVRSYLKQFDCRTLDQLKKSNLNNYGVEDISMLNQSLLTEDFSDEDEYTTPPDTTEFSNNLISGTQDGSLNLSLNIKSFQPEKIR